MLFLEPPPPRAPSRFHTQTGRVLEVGVLCCIVVLKNELARPLLHFMHTVSRGECVFLPTQQWSLGTDAELLL